MHLQAILTDCDIAVGRYQQLHGGDINLSYGLQGDKKYFLKVNDAERYPDMFAREAAGLNELAGNCTLRVPAVIKYGVAQQQQYLLLEWIERGNAEKDTWEKFGAEIALMHLKQQPYFGWETGNYIGSLPQVNQQHESWGAFYSACRIIPLTAMLFNRGDFSKADIADVEALCNRLDQLFPPEPPSLLHGDLWSGNFMITEGGDIAIYDPAVYYGHREMDIAMSKLFGGFDQRFYHAYDAAYPLQSGWQQRLPLAQLYPLLVHAVLFGGHYIGAAKAVVNNFK